MYINSNLTPEEAVRLYPDAMVKLSDHIVAELLQELDEARAVSKEVNEQNDQWSGKLDIATHKLERIARNARYAMELGAFGDIRGLLKEIFEIANES